MEFKDFQGGEITSIFETEDDSNEWIIVIKTRDAGLQGLKCNDLVEVLEEEDYEF